MPKSITNPAELQAALGNLNAGQREAISVFRMYEKNFRTLESIYELTNASIGGSIVDNYEVTADECWEGIQFWLRARADMELSLFNER